MKIQLAVIIIRSILADKIKSMKVKSLLLQLAKEIELAFGERETEELLRRK